MPPRTHYPSHKPQPRRPARRPPPRPDRHTDRQGWNRWFETELALKYDSFKYSGPCIEDLPTAQWKCHTIQYQNLEIAGRTEQLMTTEGKVIDLALENIRFGTFEKDWSAMSMERKRELALEALYRGSCACPGDNFRHFCPELRIEGLIGDGEYNVMNLLKRLIAHSPSGSRYIKDVFLFEHPYVSHGYRYSSTAPDLLKAWVRASMLYRNFCIVDTLHGLLDAYNGRPFIPTTFVKHQPKEHHDKAHGGKNCCDNSHCKEMNANKKYACSKCSKIMERSKLKLCSGCKLTFYCGGECQKKDWAQHKKLCGKQDFDPECALPHSLKGPADFIGCPPVSAGYTRTPALWRQIEYLSKPDSQERLYHFDTGPDTTRSIVLPFPAGAHEFFLVARRRAMASGSIPAVHMMFNIATNSVDPATGITWNGLSVEQIRKQFEREYHIKITEETMRAAGPFELPTQRELKEEREFYQRRVESVHMKVQG
ncbi:hypothetical protein FB45DRAFT_901823 [Roridomyces roridus]|uniref:MYND-type domain-containing protein n=1 Tax=Roridomyces roridus TaxID=1738132 RepID=A0AAD7CAX1_9AGAR|nr:hypothetical protein FB45DRAFT_901823 [Roridomyces roridus]